MWNAMEVTVAGGRHMNRSMRISQVKSSGGDDCKGELQGALAR
jgi:hypothetical protein